jgi:hypothetical protein
MAVGSRHPSGSVFMQLMGKFTMHQYAREYFPVASANCFCTSDGRWLQCLGVDLPRHLPKMIKVLGLITTVR